MGRPVPRFRRFAAALALACLLGCASEPPQRERSVLLGAENRVCLILPLNVAMAMPRELEFYSPILWAELERYLRAQGKQLKTVARKTARELWIQSIQKVRAGEKGQHAGFDEAAAALAVELRTHADFDVMIAPSLVLRQATVVNRSAHWDGVARDIEFDAQGLAARNLASTPLEGAAPAATLHVAVFDAKGEKLHEGKGGLDLLVRVHVDPANDSGAPAFHFVVRSDPFQNREHLREGIAAAFQPFLPPLPE